MHTPKPIPLSALQHYAFCPRQCALIHNEQQWAENYLTAHGQLLHQKVDRGEPESRQGVRFERGVQVSAPSLGLTGKLDLVEIDKATGQMTPVEYKRGKAKPNDVDKVQLCAQALCLEQMTGKEVTQGAIWYWQTRRRLPVTIDKPLREQTMAVIKAVAELFEAGNTPAAKFGKHCKACSLADICNPKLVTRDSSAAYVEGLFKTD